MNVRIDALKDLVTRFDNNITAYKDLIRKSFAERIKNKEE